MTILTFDRIEGELDGVEEQSESEPRVEGSEESAPTL
jgi:hypothetical protein